MGNASNQRTIPYNDNYNNLKFRRLIEANGGDQCDVQQLQTLLQYVAPIRITLYRTNARKSDTLTQNKNTFFVE